MNKASVHRMHKAIYNESKYPPLPARIRLSACNWERVWWLTLTQPLAQPDQLDTFVKRFSSDNVSVRAQMRTHRRMCFAVVTEDIDEQSEFEIAMNIMSHIERELSQIERVEDRTADAWPYLDF